MSSPQATLDNVRYVNYLLKRSNPVSSDSAMIPDETGSRRQVILKAAVKPVVERAIFDAHGEHLQDRVVLDRAFGGHLGPGRGLQR